MLFQVDEGKDADALARLRLRLAQRRGPMLGRDIGKARDIKDKALKRNVGGVVVDDDDDAVHGALEKFCFNRGNGVGDVGTDLGMAVLTYGKVIFAGGEEAGVGIDVALVEDGMDCNREEVGKGGDKRLESDESFFFIHDNGTNFSRLRGEGIVVVYHVML